jgi:hydrogenase small subunit
MNSFTETQKELTVGATLQQRGVSRRAFLKLCGLMAATLALPRSEAEVIARALDSAPRLPVIWLEFQDCTGDTESFIRASQRSDPLVESATDPSIVDLLLDVLSVDYHETLMAPAGEWAEASRRDTLANYAGQYLCVVEGSIPTAQGGAYCVIGGRTALGILDEVARGALATIALGACACDGGLAAASPNPTAAVGVRQAVPGLSNLIALPGCPANVVNLVATVVYYLTYGRFPALRDDGLPDFAYHEDIHDECERHDHYEEHRFVRDWGDEGHRQGWCLKKMGCRGPRTRHNCPTVRWNDGTCWPVAAGHGCVGCAHPSFWDALSPFYVEIRGDDDDEEEEDDD